MRCETYYAMQRLVYRLRYVPMSLDVCFENMSYFTLVVHNYAMIQMTWEISLLAYSFGDGWCYKNHCVRRILKFSDPIAIILKISDTQNILTQYQQLLIYLLTTRDLLILQVLGGGSVKNFCLNSPACQDLQTHLK